MRKKQNPFSCEFDFLINRPQGDFDDPQRGTNGPLIISAWKDAVLVLSNYSIHCNGYDVCVKIDWIPLIRRLQHDRRISHRISEALHTKMPKKAFNELFTKFRRSPVRIKCVVVARRKRGVKPRYEPALRAIGESFLHDVFLIMNFAFPGSINFYHCRIRSRNSTFESEVSLSSSQFLLARLDGQKGRWPQPKLIPVDVVQRWYFQVRNGISQMPRSTMEKVLFATMHLASGDLSPDTAIWIFYALETLFDTKPGENFRVLKARILLLLSASNTDEVYLQKKLRSLYDFRSAFIHGGLDVAHLMHNEILDSEVEKDFERIMTNCDFGFAVLLRSIQEFILRGMVEPRFVEVLRDDKAASSSTTH